MPVSVVDGLLRVGHAAALLGVAAGITHLSTVLALPARGPDSLWEHVRRAKEANVGDTLAGGAFPALGPDQDPTLATALCRFDLRAGAVKASLGVADVEFAFLTVLSRHGRVLGSLTSRAAAGDRLVLSVVAAGTPPPSATGPARDIRVEAPEPEGLVVAQVLFSTASRRDDAEAAARGLSCRPAPPPGGRPDAGVALEASCRRGRARKRCGRVALVGQGPGP